MPNDDTQNDLNKGGAGASGGGQPGKEGEGSGQPPQPKMVQISETELGDLKSELEQTKSDRDNYRKATLDKKANERSLDDKKDDKAGNQGGQGGSPDVNTVVDEKLNAFQDKTRKSLQARAQRKFLNKNQDFADDAKWARVASHLHLRGDEVTEEDFADRIDEAHLLYMRETGQLEKHLESERQKAKRQGEIEGQVNSGMQAGDTGDGRSGGQGKGSLSPQGEEMARRSGHDPEKIKKIDLTKDRSIDLSKV